jgi:dTDP-4-amino-4,6-dideoxygalactose transaminase
MIFASKIYNLIITYFKVPYFGFVQGHSHLSKVDLKNIYKFIKTDDPKIIEKFESEFSDIVGQGGAVSFASGRMGFYALMKIKEVGQGDEVVLLGATCSVMVNAVFRVGAKPVYADMDPDTFGSSAKEIKKVISPKTKMIVAQHSFGIPCDIIPIVNLARDNGIFLLEDCALTLGSSIKGMICGNFGDAALFSTDHSKALNTLIGGLIYTQNTFLLKKLKFIQKESDGIPDKRQDALWQQLLFERKYYRPDRYGQSRLLEALYSTLKIRNQVFLNEDFGSSISVNATYPYPAKLPAFLAVLGLEEIAHWKKTAEFRQNLLQKLLATIGNKGELPLVYFDLSRRIVPLRLAWATKDGSCIRDRLSGFICTSWTWFMQPIVATNESLKAFGYTMGDCPISEKLGERMVNIPCNFDEKWSIELQKKLEGVDNL